MNLSGLGYPDQRQVPVGWQWPKGIKRLERPRWPQSERLYQLAQAVPTLDLQFAATRSLVDNISGQNLITFSRASSATYIGSDGLLKTATTNEPRFDHNPITGESLGLLVEEQRTNSIRNNTMVGAVAGTPGTQPTYWGTTTTAQGLSRQIVSTGIVNGINYIRVRVFGTTTGVFTFFAIGPGDNVAASTNQTWTGSAYYALNAGSLSGVTLQHELARFNASSGYLGSTVSPFTPLLGQLSTAQRYSFTATLTDPTLGLLGYSLQLVVPSSGTVVDFTIDIGLPQLEQGAFATSVIPTTTAAATRAADVASITGAAFSSWYRQDEGTICTDHLNRTGATGALQVIVNLNNNGTDQQFIHVVAANFLSSNAFVANVSQGRLDSVTPVANTMYRAAVNYGQSSRNLAVNGLAYGTSTGLTPTITQMAIGQNGGSALNGTIRRITYFPARLPNITLQRVTQ
jgi:hypothetical protein